MTKTRFAPSPTGLLHIGNVRTALLNCLLARKTGGTFILRFDDTDQERSREDYVDQARRDLEWLGLHWDEEVRQSSRIDRYDECAEDLRSRGALYECFESREELALKRKLQLQRGQPPIYDRSATQLDEEKRCQLRADTPGYWRYLLNGGEVAWNDGIQGDVSIYTSNVSDPVLVRADGQYLYTFASVIDDLDMGITHIIRGSDHLTNTAVQVQIMQAFNRQPPDFAHHSLLIDPTGVPLSKRDGSLSITGLRDMGIEPMAIVSQLACLGTPDRTGIASGIDELAESLDLGSFSSNPTQYNVSELRSLTGDYYRDLDYTHVAEQIGNYSVPPHLARPFWMALRANIDRLSDLEAWWGILEKGVNVDVDEGDRKFVEQAFAMLPPPPYDVNTWSTWTRSIGNATGRKGARLFMPLRLALTGRKNGPSMRDLMPLMQTVRHPGK